MPDHGSSSAQSNQKMAGDWRLATGDWRLATGDWRLATGEQLDPAIIRGRSFGLQCHAYESLGWGLEHALRLGTKRTSIQRLPAPQESLLMTIGLLLSIIFMVLKLTGHIDWHWAIVFLPAIVEFALSLVVYRSPFWWRGRSN